MKMKSRLVCNRRWCSIGKGSFFAITGIVSVVLLFVQWQYHLSMSLPGRDGIVKDALEPLHHSGIQLNKPDEDQDMNKEIMLNLNQQIQELQFKLRQKMDLISRVGKMEKEEKMSLLNKETYRDLDETELYLKNQIESSNIIRPHQYRNEYDLPPFSSFTRKFIYRLDNGLIKQPEIVLPFYQDINMDLLEVINAGTKEVNDPKMDFIEGFYRTQHHAGTQYELTFKSNANASAPLRLITLFRPYGPLHTVSSIPRDTVETIYVIVPLQGRGDSFKKFMTNFEDAAITADGNVHLTVVCYGSEALIDAKEILSSTEKTFDFKSYQIVEGKSGEFSRGRALQEGTSKLPGKNVLMFFCDVDMFFTSEFLTQCRSQTRSGSKVFYPIVFSLYNPEIVYKGKQIPSLIDQQVIRRDNGFWRDFGFGMTCQYKEDFHDIGGFDLTIKGWGSEDVLLYRKYTRSTKYQVVRTPINSLFHHWHPKHCDRSLSLEQYNACLRTRSLTEGSQIQLGMLYLKDKEED